MLIAKMTCQTPLVLRQGLPVYWGMPRSRGFVIVARSTPIMKECESNDISNGNAICPLPLVDEECKNIAGQELLEVYKNSPVPRYKWVYGIWISLFIYRTINIIDS